jgi:thiamine-triphosphatase
MALRATRALLRATAEAAPSRLAPSQKPTTKPTILEVERKFRRLTVPTLTNLIHHDKNNTTRSATTGTSIPRYNPLFIAVQPLPTRTIHDIYYDTPDRILSSSGAWIRRRNDAWEAKVRRAGWKGDFVNSRFEELRGARDVGRVVADVLGRTVTWDGDMEEGGFGLGKLAEFVTTREAWVVDGQFKVVRDRMDFGHEVGEVELQVEVGGSGGGDLDGDGKMHVGEEEKAALMDEMDRRIEAFMERYSWAWEEGEAVGKLTAYFEMGKRSGGREWRGD